MPDDPGLLLLVSFVATACLWAFVEIRRARRRSVRPHNKPNGGKWRTEASYFLGALALVAILKSYGGWGLFSSTATPSNESQQHAAADLSDANRASSLVQRRPRTEESAVNSADKAPPLAVPPPGAVTVYDFPKRVLTPLPHLAREPTCGPHNERGDGRIHCLSIIHKDPQFLFMAESAVDSAEVAWLSLSTPSLGGSEELTAMALVLFSGVVRAFSPQLNDAQRRATISRLVERLPHTNHNVRVGRYVYSLAPVLPIDNPPLVFTVATLERDRELDREWKALRK